MSLTNDTKRTLEALALAQAADLLAQRENEAQPGGHPVPAASVRHAPQVALLAEATLTAPLLDYALDSCRHCQASLILIDPLPQQAERLAAWVQRIESAHIPLTVCPLPHASLASLHDFTLNQPRLLFVILGSAAHQALGVKQMQWHSPAPLVVVSEQVRDHSPARVTLRS